MGFAEGKSRMRCSRRRRRLRRGDLDRPRNHAETPGHLPQTREVSFFAPQKMTEGVKTAAKRQYHLPEGQISLPQSGNITIASAIISLRRRRTFPSLSLALLRRPRQLPRLRELPERAERLGGFLVGAFAPPRNDSGVISSPTANKKSQIRKNNSLQIGFCVILYVSCDCFVRGQSR